MNDFIPALITLEEVPGEPFFLECLQKHIVVTLENRLLRKGRLMLFNRSNYFIQLSLINDRGNRENLEVPIPFNIEYHREEGLMYFDYRISALRTDAIPRYEGKSPSNFFNKIVEIQAV